MGGIWDKDRDFAPGGSVQYKYNIYIQYANIYPTFLSV